MHETLMSTIGDRINYCRLSLKLTRKELSELWKMASVPTIARWELNVVKIPLKKLASLVDFFCNNGLIGDLSLRDRHLLLTQYVPS
ncbi:MAG: hypothetical protein H0U57_13635 [Tatlockia sp.]|nr:hypothetical protein [Tatlockia sp.]